MADKTLKQRIQLEGGEKFEKTLKSLGEQGEKAFNKVKKASEDMAKSGSTVNRFAQSVASAFNKIERAADNVSKSFGNFKSALGGLAKSVAVLGTAAAGVGAALFKVTQNATESADEHGKAAAAVGLNVQEYGRLRFAMEQSGADAAKMQTSMTILNKNIGEAAKGGNDAAKMFKTMGVEIRDSSGNMRAPSDILKDISDRFSAVPDGALKAAAAVKLFGRSGAEIIPFLNEGSASIENMGNRAEQLGIVFTDQQVKIATVFNDNLSELMAGVRGTLNQIGLQFAPELSKLFIDLTDILIANKDRVIEAAKTVSTAVNSVIRDIIALVSGAPDSAINNTWILDIRDGIIQIGEAAKFVGTVIKTAFDAAKIAVEPFVATINSFLGTDFSASTIVMGAALLQLTGAFSVLTTGITLALSVFGLLITLLTNPLALAIAGVAIAGYLLYENWGEITQGISDLTTQMVEWISEKFSNLQETLSGVADRIGGFFSRAWEGMSNLASTIAQGIADAWNFALDSIASAFRALLDIAKGVFDSIISAAKSAAAAVAAIFSGSNTSGDDAGTMEGFAGGGHVRGRGTGTSDSMFARLSNGEYVQRAAAVRKYGVAFMDKLNRLQLPSDFFRGYAEGGLVTVPQVPESGASASLSRPLNLTIDGQTFAGLLMPEDVARKLERFATSKAIYSGGKKPGWYR